MGKKRKFWRSFNGLKFAPQVVCNTRKRAEETASSLRRKGSLARVTKQADGFVVWLGGKRKRRV